jgi:hypothetical protein
MRPGLTNTFSHLVSREAEDRLWSRGLHPWTAYERAGAGVFSAPRHEALLCGLAASRRALRRRSAAFFLRSLRDHHRARVLGDFLGETLFVDVETDGLGPGARITTVATYDGSEIRLYVRDVNLDSLVRDLRKARLLITFNGTMFDLPLLRMEFGWNGSARHLDLRPVLMSLGYRGSLKAIEAARGIARPSALSQTGAEAVELWNRNQQGDGTALRSLLAYNAADVAGLLSLAAWAWHRSWDGYPSAVAPLSHPPISGVYQRIMDTMFFESRILPLVVL